MDTPGASNIQQLASIPSKYGVSGMDDSNIAGSDLHLRPKIACDYIGTAGSVLRSMSTQSFYSCKSVVIPPLSFSIKVILEL